jgi:hypothetical protein
MIESKQCFEQLSDEWNSKTCKRETFCDKAVGCEKCVSGYSLNSWGSCVYDPCASFSCPENSRCKDKTGFPECYCKKGFVMTFQNESSERWCTTVVDAVKWDASLLPTDDKGEPLIAFAPVGLIDGLDADSPNFYVFVGLFALVAVCLCAAFAVLAHHISAKHKEHKEDIVLMKDTITPIHHKVEDLHLMTFHDDTDDEEEGLIWNEKKWNEQPAGPNGREAKSLNDGLEKDGPPKTQASASSVLSMLKGQSSDVRRFSDPGSVPEDHGEADAQDHSLRGKLRDTARHVMMEEKAAKAMGMRSKVNKIRRKRGLPLNPEFEKLLGRA